MTKSLIRLVNNIKNADFYTITFLAFINIAIFLSLSLKVDIIWNFRDLINLKVI